MKINKLVSYSIFFLLLMGFSYTFVYAERENIDINEQIKSDRPQTPKSPFPYKEEDVHFTNNRGKIRLAGTLTLPNLIPPYPAVILISGSGGHDRDYTLFGHKPFLVLSDHLTRKGISVLRFDDRGIGNSSGERAMATTKDYAGDVLAGLEFLKSRRDINSKSIGLIGHSEGGTIASLVTLESIDVAFIVMIATPGLPGIEYNYQYEEYTSRALGLSEEKIIEKLLFQEKVFNIILMEKDKRIARYKLKKIYKEKYPDLPEDRVDKGIARLLSPWFLFNLTYDPGSTLKSITCPVLAIFGEKDVQVPPEGNVKAMKSALSDSTVEDYLIKILPKHNHFMQIAKTGSPLEYVTIEETISPIALESISNWVLSHSITSKGCDNDEQ